MTAIVGWIQRGRTEEESALYVVADSRVTESKSRELLMDDAVKCMAVQVRCTWAEGTYHSHSIGYSFAGSSLLGLNTFAHFANFCGTLNGLNPNAVPSLENLAQLCAEIFLNQCHRFRERHEQEPVCNILVYGYCHPTRSLRMFLIDPGGFGEVDLADPSYIGHVGQARMEIATRIVEERDLYESDDPRWGEAPRKILQEFIDNDQFPGIGGAMQMSIATEDGVMLFSNQGPIFADPARRGLLAFGFFGKVGWVGPCFLGMGIAPDP